MANYYLRIKITLKLDQTHQSIGNSPAMMLELKEVSIERGVTKLLFWNKITLKLAQTHQSIGNSLAMLLELKEVRKGRGVTNYYFGI